MKFKENAIKPGMVIHCPKEEDARALLEHLESLGYRWTSGLPLTDHSNFDRAKDSIYYQLCDDGTVGFYASEQKHSIEFSNLIESEPDIEFEVKDCGDTITSTITEHGKITSELSELIEPEYGIGEMIKPEDITEGRVTDEMSAVEVLEWLDAVKRHPDAMEETFGVNTFGSIFDCNTPRKILERITAYEAAKKAPEPVEVEWVDVVRIIKIGDMGRSVCVCERDIIGATDDDLVKQGVEFALREYITEHEGEYFAVHQRQCRVKEDK